jgi:inner membrane protein
MSNENPNFLEKTNNWMKNSITLRIFTIGIVILLLLIPVNMVEKLIQERENRLQEAIWEVNSKWGKAQTITGLVLSIPYKTRETIYKDAKNYETIETVHYANFLPENLEIEGNLNPEIRYRGIYKVVVYNSKVKLKGKFSDVNFNKWKISPSDILWDEASIGLGLSDLRSIQDDIKLNWNQNEYFLNPGVPNSDVIGSGMSTRVPFLFNDSSADKLSFSIDLNFNGSSSLNFIPLGKTTKVHIKSNWSTPSFDGAFLPDERQISDSGFTAKWKVLHLNRPYPQSFIGSNSNVAESSFGINLILPIDEYQKSMRSAKYAVMFITLTFLIFFFVQILNGVRIHPIQYFFIGLALVIFYLLLIALSEHMSFNISYLIASISVIGLITLYTKSVFNKAFITRLILLILMALYIFIFTIIQMEDYALLMGSIGLFIVLSIVMYLSRKIDWYAIRSKPKEY